MKPSTRIVDLAVQHKYEKYTSHEIKNKQKIIFKLEMCP